MVRSGPYSKVLCFGGVVAAAALSATGCLTSSADDDSRNTGGTGGTAVAAGGTAGMTAAAGSTSTCDLSAPPQICSMMPAPSTGKIVDFTTYTSSGAWGVAANGDLTGGTSPYSANGNAMNLTVAASGDTLHITGVVPMTLYAGEVFWFGPCVDASAFGGVSFTIGGDPGGANVKVQVQSADDYPIDAGNMKGACKFTDCSTKFNDCTPPTAAATVTTDSTLVSLPWASFTGGNPVPEVTTTGLVGIQFQFECGAATDCNIDVTLGAIDFIPAT